MSLRQATDLFLIFVLFYFRVVTELRQNCIAPKAQSCSESGTRFTVQKNKSFRFVQQRPYASPAYGQYSITSQVKSR